MGGELLVPVREAARRLGVSESQAWKMLRERKLPSVKLGPKMRRVRVADLEAFIAGLDDVSGGDER